MVPSSVMCERSVEHPALKGRLKRSVKMLVLSTKTGRGWHAHRRSLNIRAYLHKCTEMYTSAISASAVSACSSVSGQFSEDSLPCGVGVY